jgi:hypothetical protein
MSQPLRTPREILASPHTHFKEVSHKLDRWIDLAIGS